MYELTNVTKSYQTKRGLVKAMDDVTLSIKEGDMVSIQGPTGGGKSTLLQMLGGLDRPTSGSIKLGGQAIEKLGDTALAGVRAEKIGFVFQNYNLIPTLTALENVEMALVPLGLPAEERTAKALAALEAVQLSERASHLPSELSGGQQQRVAIARAIVKEPAVILADEPTGNLDEATRDDIIHVLENLWKDKGITLVIVTHDSYVAKRAKTHLRIEAGKVKVTKAA
jgi:putative ABC transport system ATP-binding protein